MMGAGLINPVLNPDEGYGISFLGRSCAVVAFRKNSVFFLHHFWA